MEFQIGEKVVYPNQGVGIVEQISTRNLTGQPEMFYLLKLSSSSMRVMVPMSSVASVGLRRVTRNSEISGVLDYLQKGSCKSAPDWKGRFKENSEKMRSGSLMQVAEVLKTLIILNQAKPLSFREKKMLDRAGHMLVSDISIARNVPEIHAGGMLQKALLKAGLSLPAAP